MKQLFTLTITLGLLLSLTACSDAPIENASTTTQPAVTTTATEAMTVVTLPTSSSETWVVSDPTVATTTVAQPITTTTTTAAVTTTTSATVTTTDTTTAKEQTTTTVVPSNTVSKTTLTTQKTSAAAALYISKDEAVRIALEHAQVKKADVRDLDADFDFERAVPVYEVDFECGRFEYDYTIHAETGGILVHHKEDPVASTGQGFASQTAPKPSGITLTVAKDLALKHAGVSADTLRDYEATLDTDDGVYDISFESGGFEYEYEIDAKTGAVVKCEKERLDE